MSDTTPTRPGTLRPAASSLEGAQEAARLWREREDQASSESAESLKKALNRTKPKP